MAPNCAAASWCVTNNDTEANANLRMEIPSASITIARMRKIPQESVFVSIIQYYMQRWRNLVIKSKKFLQFYFYFPKRISADAYSSSACLKSASVRATPLVCFDLIQVGANFDECSPVLLERNRVSFCIMKKMLLKLTEFLST